MRDRRPSPSAAIGCDDARLAPTRRGVVGLGLGAGLFAAGMRPRLASAAGATDPRLLVVVLRGGMDGLSVVAPYGDPNYASARGGLALAKADLVDIDGFFGLNPALGNFAGYLAAAQGLAVQATCTPLRTRSHFDCQDNLETGLPGLAGSDPTGWINRLLGVLPAAGTIRSHGALEIGDAPLILRGPQPVLGWSPTWFEPAADTTAAAAQANYDAIDPIYGEAFAAGLATDRLARSVGGSYASLSGLRLAMTGAGRLLGAAAGPRIAVVSAMNWDTHAGEGGPNGLLTYALSDLDAGLGDFRAAIGDAAWAQTVVVMATEFGRTVAMNGTAGSDHGVGTATLLAGGAVAGGKVLGQWPGLGPANLWEDGNLAPTTDLRAIFKGVLQDHLGVPRKILDRTIFPDSATVTPMTGLVATPKTTATATVTPAAVPLSPIARWRAGLPASRG